MNHPYTHKILVDMAVRWLGRTCPVVIAEMATTGETPDAIGWGQGTTTLVECKVSRSDLRADACKPWRMWPERGLGRRRFLLVPAGLATVADLPPGWGLLEAHGTRIRRVCDADYQPKWNQAGEAGLLLSAIRRSVTASTVGVSVKCYTIDSRGTAQLHVEREGMVDTGVAVG